jgi:hypothetical protein
MDKINLTLEERPSIASGIDTLLKNPQLKPNDITLRGYRKLKQGGYQLDQQEAEAIAKFLDFLINSKHIKPSADLVAAHKKLKSFCKPTLEVEEI